MWTAYQPDIPNSVFVRLNSTIAIRNDEAQFAKLYTLGDLAAAEDGMQQMAAKYREGGDLYMPVETAT